MRSGKQQNIGRNRNCQINKKSEYFGILDADTIKQADMKEKNEKKNNPGE